MKPNFTDERGTINDLLVNDIGSVTHITFIKGAVRGNHIHNKTTQNDFVLKGRLIVSLNGVEREIKAGDHVNIPATVPHAYKALEDSETISICLGIRKGEEYENDTIRLETPLL